MCPNCDQSWLKKKLKNKILKILDELDGIHTEGFVLPEEKDKFADRILDLFPSLLQDFAQEVRLENRYVKNELNAGNAKYIVDEIEGYNSAKRELDEKIKRLKDLWKKLKSY